MPPFPIIGRQLPDSWISEREQPRFTIPAPRILAASVEDRIADLERELASLRATLTGAEGV